MTKNISPKLDTPVLLLIFNRPDTTKQVFEAIREFQPSKLFVAADGPRPNKPGEYEKCEEARRIATAVDWDCEVKTFFRDSNVGCGIGPAGGISWFFQCVEEGIILEDDCLPSPLFFRFCSELLERYRDDKRVMQIGGSNFIEESIRDKDYSYYFSNHNNTWGWATWKRAWDLYDFDMSNYDLIKSSGYLANCFTYHHEFTFFKWILDRTYADIQHVSWWDYQWELARRINSGIVIVPQCNLIINIGLRADATHTVNEKGTGSKLKFEELTFPLNHPEFELTDNVKDKIFFNLEITTFALRMKLKVKALLRGVQSRFTDAR